MGSYEVTFVVGQQSFQLKNEYEIARDFNRNQKNMPHIKTNLNYFFQIYTNEIYVVPTGLYGIISVVHGFLHVH